MSHWLDWVERWFEQRYDLHPIGAGGYIARLSVQRYRGATLLFRDGTVLQSGDVVAELHVDNHRTGVLHKGGHAGVRYRREVFRMLFALAEQLSTNPEYRTVQAVGGVSLFWAEASHAGFEHWPLSWFTRWWLGWWERFLLIQYHPAGRSRLSIGHRTEVRQIWMSRKTLVERYGQHALKTVQGEHSPG
jgi:peptidoglycan-N-acetylglucosamine deacetylase